MNTISKVNTFCFEPSKKQTKKNQQNTALNIYCQQLSRIIRLTFTNLHMGIFNIISRMLSVIRTMCELHTVLTINYLLSFCRDSTKLLKKLTDDERIEIRNKEYQR